MLEKKWRVRDGQDREGCFTSVLREVLTVEMVSEQRAEASEEWSWGSTWEKAGFLRAEHVGLV